MPELPEVESYKNYFLNSCLQKRVKSVEVLDSHMLKNIKAEELEAAFNGYKFTSVFRHGKYLMAENELGNFLVLHFGMTGSLKLVQNPIICPYSSLVIHFDTDTLCIISKRKLGKIMLTADRLRFIGNRGLGPDAARVTSQEFMDLFSTRKAKIKTALLNQAIIAGVGNIYADEICFQAGIRPYHGLSLLSLPDLNNLYRCLQQVISLAIKVDADYSQMPANWLLHHRHKGDCCPKCGGALEYFHLSGRGTYYCPQCQY